MNEAGDDEKQRREMRREMLLQLIAERLEAPMVVLGLAWLVLLIVDLVYGLSPLLTIISSIIWAIFILDFLLEFSIAPRKGAYLKRNWLTLIALLVPALRILRVIQTLRLMRVLSSIYRGMRALGASLGRHGFRYVAALTLAVTFAGAAGMYAFERTPPHGPGLASYPQALWWTAMIMTTLGSGYWPQTPEGRVLCILLSLYAFSVFGYVTAAIASFLVGREAQQPESELPSATSITELHNEITRLREEVRKLTERISKDGS